MKEESETFQEIENTTKQVRRLLEYNDKARNNLKFLQYLVWKERCSYEGVEFHVPFEIFNLLPSTETIARVKRHIQNTLKECQKEDTIKQLNSERETEFRKYYGKN